MKKLPRTVYSLKRWMAFSLIMGVALLFTNFAGNEVSANHPVLVEGNCDSPVPGTTIVQQGTCGDYDGDGRIGTAEDTDGADRIFGTINAALGNGTGAATGTGANMNGTVTIVTSGRFAESVAINPTSLGQVTLQAAPGVSAEINAVLQGDPAGNNVPRQNGIGINVNATSFDNKVILRNLTIRNYATGVNIQMNSRVTMENCRLESNLDYGIRLLNNARLEAKGLRIASTGFRIGPGVPTVTTLGHAISFEGASAGTVFHSQITGSFGAAITNTSSGGPPAVRYYEVFLGFNGADIVGATRESAP
ncbi:MAG TPA: right-handed parallel beta-helix repeat-containing protein [Pyrinomonadaceae bacterium]|nr:right-handed parallel beta-helix repeat-containing protein [Pyrinomonadaceae bacterium]